MRHNFILSILIFLPFWFQAQVVNIPDSGFYNELFNGYGVTEYYSGTGPLDANGDGVLQQSEADNVKSINVYRKDILSLQGIQGFRNLKYLNCQENGLTALDLSQNLQLVYLDCSANPLSTLDVSANTQLENLSCFFNQLSALDISTNSQLKRLSCSRNYLTSLDVSANSLLEEIICSDNQLTGLELSQNSNLLSITCNSNQLIALDLSQNSNLLRLRCDSNQLTTLDLSPNSFLRSLKCGGNQLSNLNLEGNSNLEHLEVNNNELISINLDQCEQLKELHIQNNSLTQLNVGNCVNLTYLNCYYNNLSTLNLNGLSNLNRVEISGNNLSQIDLSGLSRLETLYVGSNDIEQLDLTPCPSLKTLSASYTKLVNLDVSMCPELSFLDVAHNLSLISLNIKNGSSFFYNQSEWAYGFQIWNTPNLKYVCLDPGESYPNVNFQELNIVATSYCSLTGNGDDVFLVQGQTQLDNSGDGCTSNSLAYAQLTVNAEGNEQMGSFISSGDGEYKLPVVAGSHTLTPALESDYYTVSSQSTTVTFPDDSNPYVLDFCVSPAGVFNDLEVQVVPLGQARPGFDATYKILYKNKGTTTLSGDIVLAFHDNTMDFQSASITPSNQTTGQLTWHYSDLAPLTSGEIGFIMKINTPTDTNFPVNSGNILTFTATINPLANEETVEDNTFSLRQEVVNSYDPNDKQCLEGKYVHPDDVGKYIHFMIRFENTGTASARNVVIKDEIDESRFDMASFKPVNGSHSFVTRIKEENKLEFIFENINLLFDDANNDGYVVFKIKTLPSLQLNDVLKNKAAIYFDYNAPIITNEAEIVIGRPLLAGENDILLGQNPVLNDLEVLSNTPIQAVYVIDIRGRKVLERSYVKEAQQAVLDVGNLTQGFYLVKVKTEGRDFFKRFIKK